MSTIHFPHNKIFSVGAEIEFQLLNPETFDLSALCPTLLKQVPQELQHNFKAEFIQSMVEIVTDKCDNLAEISDNLHILCSNLDTICNSIGCLPYATSLHPFTILEQRKISDDIRYHQIYNDLQLVGKRLITQGLHIHIGLPDSGTAIRVTNSIRSFLPILLAITASSPFYLNDDTGFQSYRSILFGSLPRSGIPPKLKDWNHYVKYILTMQKNGVINSAKEIWWDVRPHPEFGTIEIRICDLPPRLEQILAIIAIVQALVATLASNKSIKDHDFNIIQNNKWQAARYGTNAHFIDEKTTSSKKIKQVYLEMLDFIEPKLQAFKSTHYTTALATIFDTGNSAEQYRLLYEKYHNHSLCIQQIQGEFWS